MNTQTINGQNRTQWMESHRDEARIASRIEELLASSEAKILEYTDPHPDKLGKDRLYFDCGKCHGTGLYAGHSGYEWVVNGEKATYCFECKGHKQKSILVSTERRNKRQAIRSHNERAEVVRRTAPEIAAEEEDRRLSAAWDKALSSSLQDAAQEIFPEGEKFSPLQATVSRLFVADGYYGKSLGVAFSLEAHTDTEMVWFTNAAAAYELEEGDSLTLAGMVKRISEFRGHPSITVTRCKITDHRPQDREDAA